MRLKGVVYSIQMEQRLIMWQCDMRPVLSINWRGIRDFSVAWTIERASRH